MKKSKKPDAGNEKPYFFVGKHDPIKSEWSARVNRTRNSIVVVRNRLSIYIPKKDLACVHRHIGVTYKLLCQHMLRLYTRYTCCIGSRDPVGRAFNNDDNNKSNNNNDRNSWSISRPLWADDIELYWRLRNDYYRKKICIYIYIRYDVRKSLVKSGKFQIVANHWDVRLVGVRDFRSDRS